MDNKTLQEYKFMDTPELKPENPKRNKKEFQNNLNWMLNNLIRGDN